jgi:hypothetical protein
MELLGRVDNFLIDQIFQKIADLVHDRTGKSNFWLAGLCCWLSIIFWMLSGLSIYYFTPDRRWYPNLFLAFWGLFPLLNFRKKDEKWQNHGNRVANSDRITLWFVRYSFLVFSVVGFFVTPIRFLLENEIDRVWTYFAIFSNCISLYFAACTPRPPKLLRAGNPLAVQTT